MHHSVAENVFLNLCKKCFATTENSVEKVEKPYRKMGRFLKSRKIRPHQENVSGPYSS